jgi:hypothetical protein
MTTFRKVCRWLHRELGYVAVGLTLIYAISGIAVNHAHHWNANYQQTRQVSEIEPVGTGSTEELVPVVLARLQLSEPVKNTWRAAPERLQVFVEGATLDVNLLTGEVTRTDVQRRPLLYEFNYLHLNTGKAPWTGISDIFAGVLIILALTGIFLVHGRKGLAGRGGVLMGLGFLLPLIYIVLEIYG